LKTVPQRIESVIWPLIFGGMFVGALGFSLQRERDAFGWTLVVAGACAIVAGIVFIWVRSRLPAGPPSPSIKPETLE
jgi:ABC-type sulfate transport system permease component